MEKKQLEFVEAEGRKEEDYLEENSGCFHRSLFYSFNKYQCIDYLINVNLTVGYTSTEPNPK